MNKIRDGKLRLILNRVAKDVGDINSAIGKAIGSEAICTTMTDMTKIKILYLDEETLDQEIIDAIDGKTGKTNTVRILSKRKTLSGTLSIFILVSSSEAASLVSSKLRIDYVNYRVRKAVVVIRCLR